MANFFVLLIFLYDKWFINCIKELDGQYILLASFYVAPPLLNDRHSADFRGLRVLFGIGGGMMLSWQIRILIKFYMALDFFAFIISIPVAFGFALYIGINHGIHLKPMDIYVFTSIIYLIYLSFFLLTQPYNIYLNNKKPNVKKLVTKHIIAFIPGHLLSYLILSAFFPGYAYLFSLLHGSIYFLLSLLVKVFFFSWRNKGVLAAGKQRNLLLVGQSANGLRYLATIRRYTYLHYNVIGFIHIKEKPTKSQTGLHEIYGDLPHLGGLENLNDIVSRETVDEIVFTRPQTYDQRLADALQDMQKRGVSVTVLLNQAINSTANATVTMIESIPAIKYHIVSLHESQLMAKRILDIAGALVGIVLFGISWLIFAPLIKLESKGPVIFKQDRVGKNGRIFKMWKFRSMFDGADSKKESLQGQNEMKGHMFKITNDPRVTRIGKILRKTNIDELPQFYNVLRGEMSLVGTRPPTVDEVKEYQTHHYKRISIVPGITGLWQISGANRINDFEDVVRLDEQYIREWSVWKDVRIIAKTVLNGSLVFNAIRNTSALKIEIESLEDGHELFITDN